MPTAGCCSDVLRGEIGFTGLIVSDYGGIGLLAEGHHVAGSLGMPGRWRSARGSRSSCRTRLLPASWARRLAKGR